MISTSEQPAPPPRWFVASDGSAVFPPTPKPEGRWLVDAKPVSERLSANVVVNTKTNCWEWVGANRNGYGCLKVGGRKGPVLLAHRISYEICKGGLDPDSKVCHHCDNPSCINPDHLFVGTQADNVADMIAKGRKVSQKGVESHKAKLSEEQVYEIRSATGFTIRELAARYGVTHPQIVGIRKRRYWSHLPDREGDAR